MTPAQRERANALALSLVELPLEAREREALKVCPDDPEVRADALSLARAHDEGGDFLLGGEPPTDPGGGTTFEIGVVVAGRFRVDRFVAHGGMGEVYQAHDQVLNKTVALKTLAPDRAHVQSFRSRLQREVKLAQEIAHRNVCRTIDIHSHRTAPDREELFLSMEFIRGQTLSERLRRDGRLSPAAALPLISQMADGLAAAHRARVVHRDFKSQNVMLEDGVGEVPRVVITDFGLARGLEGTLSPSLTAGHFMGTPAYVAPEQVLTQPAGPPSDIYALGVVIYECVTGVTPFGDDAARRLREPPPSPRLHVPDLPARWETTILACLERDAARRPSTAEEVAQALKPDPRPSPIAGRRWGMGLALGSMAIVATLTTVDPRRQEVAAPPPVVREVPAVRLAVLPFRNNTGSDEYEYLADGLTEEIITDLGRHQPRIGVIAKGSVERYKGTQKPPDEIGRELNVTYLLEGSVSRNGDRVRVPARLVRVKDQVACWSGAYEGDLHDFLGFQVRIATALVTNVGPHALPSGAVSPRARPTLNPEAYEAYLKGRHFWKERTDKSLQRAIQHFQRSIQLDPAFAAAHAGLADSYALLAITTDSMPPGEARQRGNEAALAALEKDPDSAEAYASMALIRCDFDWDWAGCETALERASKLNFSYAAVHQRRGRYLMQKGRLEEAGAAFERARQLDPFDVMTTLACGLPSFYAGHYADALKQFRKGLELDPKSPLGHRLIGNAYVLSRDCARGLKELEYSRNLTLSNDPHALGDLGYAYGFCGRPGQARQVRDRLVSLARTRNVSPYDLALVDTGLSDRERALGDLEDALARRVTGLVNLRIEPRLAPLRGDPRFERVARGVLGDF